MNLIVNKKMNEGYLESYLTSIMAPNPDTYLGFTVYTDLANTENMSTNGDYPFLLFVPESYLALINKLNELNFNENLNLGGTVKFTVLMNTLYSKNTLERNSAIDYLVAQSIVTEDEVAGAKSLTTDFKNFDIAQLDMSYVDTTIPGNELLTDVIEYSYDTPVELGTYYDQTNNTNSEALYLVVLPLVNKVYGGTSGTFGDYVATHIYKNTNENSVEQTTYLAIALGDINDTTADIKYDHVDKIDYIDSFRFRFRLPKVLN